MWCGGEVAVTVGVLLLLLVVHQLWWTNRQARDGAERQVQALEQEWESGAAGGGPTVAPAPRPEDGERDREQPAADHEQKPAADKPAAPRWDQAYAVLSIPRLGVRVPVAEGVGKAGVLDKGYVGHYPRTAQPGRAGNFAVAGHRNTHGEPFRYVNRLRDGDRVEVRTRNATYTYTVDRRLAQTLPSDGGVIDPVPRSAVRPGAGYDERGYYLTLTTCTPEFSSKYRLVVWGKLTSVAVR
ncbi:class E sortase [Streptomyces sp. YC537]|uniref:Class E sortase n=1 Tax=Streptomyces boluensis TaxID=1775135 RepID=A0A964UUT9_9ACTN|nr:class E sortase [Streptomyces boluensis]